MKNKINNSLWFSIGNLMGIIRSNYADDAELVEAINEVYDELANNSNMGGKTVSEDDEDGGPVVMSLEELLSQSGQVEGETDEMTPIGYKQ